MIPFVFEGKMSSILDLSPVEFSRYDLEIGTILPRKLTPQLAEDIGIHIGDGSMGVYDNYDYLLQYGGDPSNEKEYYDNHVARLKMNLYHRHVRPRLLPSGIYGFKFKSKAVVKFYNQVIGLPLGPKNRIRIPNTIKEAGSDILIACVRGIVDTDFGLGFGTSGKKKNTYPELKAWFKSIGLVKDLQLIFEDMGFRTVVRLNIPFHNHAHYCHSVSLPGYENFMSWFKIIGSNNPKHITKYLLWNYMKVCPSSTTPQRLKLIKLICAPHYFKMPGYRVEAARQLRWSERETHSLISGYEC